jgi:hypothetical protein
MKKTDAQKTSDYEKNKKSQGFHRYWLWCKPEHIEKIRAYAKKITG